MRSGPIDANGWPAAAALAALILSAACPAARAGQLALRLPVMKAWKVKEAVDGKTLAGTFFEPRFDDASWEPADVRAKEDPYSARFVFYRKWLDVPAAWQGKRITLVFGGVDDDAVVWMNGRRLGEHKGWNTEFSFDVTQVAKCGERNLLAVLADNSGGGGAGIWKPVSLALTEEIARQEAAEEATLRTELRSLQARVIYETFHDGNWELFVASPDGSNRANVTRTPQVHELSPHASPDGTKVCFSADEGEGASRIRNVYYMSLDGTGRTLVARNARQACWSPDGGAIAYLRGEFEKFCYRDFATKGIVVYDLKTGQHREHPHKGIHHLYNLCWSPDGKWFVATVHAGMGHKHAILAIEADGTKVFNLGIPGCRPDISPDGTRVAWGPSDWALRVGDLDFSGPKPRVVNRRDIATSAKPMKIYHVDWSPCGRYVAFARGPSTKRLGLAPEIVGVRAEGWDIGVADADATNRWLAITADGKCNKEPDWVPVKK